MSSGSSPDGKTEYAWSPAMQPRWDRSLNFLDRSLFPGGIDNANADIGTFKPYTGERFQGENFNQQAAFKNSQDLMMAARSPIGSMDAASNQIQDTLGGKYMGQGANPFGGQSDNPWVSQYRNQVAYNGNPYAGMDNPAFKSMLQSGKEDITNAYNQGTSAELTRMMNMSGAFGGSAHQNAMANNQAALGKQLGQFEAGMQNDQYNRSGQMSEAGLNRGAQAEEGLLTRGNAGWQAAQDRGFQGFENERGRQMGAIGLGQNEQGLAIDRGNWANAMGNQRQQQGQREADFKFDQFNEKQNYPFKLIDLLMGNYGRAQGGTGTNTSSVYGGSKAGQYGGAALGLLSLLGNG